MKALMVATTALVLFAACRATDPLSTVKRDYPDAQEYLRWKNYALVRFPEASDGSQLGLLLRRSEGEWRVLAEDNEGFNRAERVLEYIPEIDEDGARALQLRAR